jgi:hypothetical protein
LSTGARPIAAITKVYAGDALNGLIAFFRSVGRIAEVTVTTRNAKTSGKGSLIDGELSVWEASLEKKPAAGEKIEIAVEVSWASYQRLAISGYALRDARAGTGARMRGWKLEGWKDGVWVCLHKCKGTSVLDRGEPWYCPLGGDEIAAAIKLTMTELNSEGQAVLILSGLEVFGQLSPS